MGVLTLRKRLRCWISKAVRIGFVVSLLLNVERTAAAAEVSSAPEYEIKAAYLYNFGLFVDWPNGVFPKQETPFVIGVLGVDPFEKALDRTLRQEMVRERPVVIRRMSSVEASAGCHVVFISVSEETRVRDILEYFRDKPVLTVSDISGFTKQGGCIEFVNRRNKVTMNINLAAVRQVGLRVRAELLSIANQVLRETR